MNTAMKKMMLSGIAATLVPSGTVFAQGLQIEEVVVTATRRAENLQNVPIAISAFTESELAASGIGSINDLQTQTPGLSVSKQTSGATVFIRGIGASDVSAGQEAAVATYIDGVYIPSGYGALFSFSNIERIEVLKGPQGTLFGRNATGGLIHVITKDPGSEPALDASISYGNYDTAEAKFYGSMPLGETLAADMGIIYRRQGEGWGKAVDTGREVGFEGDYFGVRGKLLYTPSDRTRITLGYEYFQSEDGDTGLTRNLTPGTVTTVGDIGFNGNVYDSVGDEVPFSEIEVKGVSLTADHEFDAFNFKSITAYREMETIQQFDNDLTPLVLFNVRIDGQAYETFTQEIQFSSNSDGRISWIAGAFFMKDDSGFAAPTGLSIRGDAVGTGIQFKNRIETESLSFFGETTFAVTDSTDLTLGVRWTKDERELSGRMDVLSAQDHWSAPVMSIPVDPNPSFDEDSPTWRLVLEHRFTDDFMGYVSYNRGFKSGNLTTTDAAAPPFESEEIDAYEIGFKSEFADGRIQLNGAAFYYDYANLQVPNVQGGFLITSNAAEAEVYGMDIEGQYLATDRLRFRFGASILNAEYTDYADAPCVAFDADGRIQEFFCDAKGNQLVRSPELEFNLAVFYNIPTDMGNYDLTLAYAYSDGYPFTVDNATWQDSYQIVNAQAKWTSPNSGLGIALFGKNLLDEEYISYLQATTWGATSSPQPPRTYGVEFSYSY